jgi:Beta/Gamma crystallin
VTNLIAPFALIEMKGKRGAEIGKTKTIKKKGSNDMAHIILFEHTNFHGAHKHVFDDGEPNLNADDDNAFNDEGTNSIVVLEGDWEFFANWKYEAPKLGELGPGLYPNIADADALGNSAHGTLSSLRPINSLGVKSKTGMAVNKMNTN